MRTCAVLAVLALGSANLRAATPWQHPLYLGHDGCWRQRVRVDLHNGMSREAAGAPAVVKVGAGAGEINLAGAAAESLRAVNAGGAEVLFAVFDPDGRQIRRGLIPAGSDLALPVEAPAGGDAWCYVYFDNPAAWAVPDFLEASIGLRNGGAEADEDGALQAWVHDAGDAQHRATWSAESPHSGEHCLRLEVDPGVPPSWIATRQSGIYVLGGAHYVLRGWVRAESVSDFAGWYVHVGNASDPMLLNTSAMAGGGSYGWTEVSVEFDAPAAAERAEIGTMLWGTGTAWFDDVALECDTPAEVTATAGPVETIAVTETGRDAPWYDDNSGDDVHWDYRVSIVVTNLTEAATAGLTQADATGLFARLGARLNRDSLRVTDGGSIVPHYHSGDGGLLFATSVPARTVHTYYLYLSEDARIPAASSDYGALVNSAENLVQNPSFELGAPMPDDWTASVMAEGTIGPDTPGLFGARCAKLHVPSGTTPSWVGWSQNVTVQPGRSYLYSAWLKTRDVASGTVQIYAHYRDAAGEYCQTRQTTTAGAAISGTHDWTQMSGAFAMPEDCVNFQLHLTMNATGTLWHDGVVLAEVQRAALGQLEARAEATPSGVVMWPVNAVVKVFQDDPAPAAIPAARITAARNEQEPLQIAIRSAEAIPGVTVEVDPPTSAQGVQLTDLTVTIVGYMPVDYPSNYYWSNAPTWYRKFPTDPGASDGWVGLWPDPLFPRSGFALAADTTQPVWVTVSVPVDAAAGDYAGKVRLVGGAGTLAELPFTVHVWGFPLPEERHLLAEYDVRLSSLWSSPGKTLEQVRDDVLDLMSRRRLCPDVIYPDPIINYSGGTVTADFTAFDLAAERYFSDLKLPRTYTPWYFYCFGWGFPPAEKWGEAPYEGTYPYDAADPSVLRPEYKAAYQACLHAYWEHMQAKGWADKVVLYLSDEPFYYQPRIIAQMKALCDMIHEVDPAIPIYVSTWVFVPEWLGYLDIWGIGHVGMTSPEQMEMIRTAGDRMVFTTDGQMCLDTPYLATERLLPYYCDKYGVEGYEFWGATWLTYNPYDFGWHAYISQSMEPGNSGWVRYPSGDGYLIYPGGLVGLTEPMSSLRLEQAREGVEDYEYLRLLRELIARAQAAGQNTAALEAALTQAQELVSIPNAGGKLSTQILPDPDAIFRAKEAVAAAIAAGFLFSDVTLEQWAFDEIGACVRAGIVGGYPDGTYRPGLPVTRDQMAVFISRALAGGDSLVPTGPPTATFSDVLTGHWAFRYVEYAVDNGVVAGYSDGTYRPTETVTRDQMAVFVARAMVGGDEYVPTGPVSATFPDVPTDHWAYKHVEYIAAEGVTRGYPDGTYRPEVAVTRDQMAVYVQRAFGLAI